MNIQVTTVGIVATPPKRLTTPEGLVMCTFRLAVSERRYNKESHSWTDGTTSWFSVTAFRTLGEHANESFAVGDRVVVAGKLRTRNWERGERTGTSVDIEAEALGHDVRWGTSSFTKVGPKLTSGESSHEPGWPIDAHEKEVGCTPASIESDTTPTANDDSHETHQRRIA